MTIPRFKPAAICRIWKSTISFVAASTKNVVPFLVALLTVPTYQSTAFAEPPANSPNAPHRSEELLEITSRANAGDSAAQVTLGFMLSAGRGLPQDYAQAAIWFGKAAEQGHASAQNNLGVMYANGYGVPEDDAQAVAWYRKAANQGEARAQFNLGAMYANGEGVPEDYIQAYAWFNLSAAQGNPIARAYRDDIRLSMTPDQIAQGQALSREWLQAMAGPRN